MGRTYCYGCGAEINGEADQAAALCQDCHFKEQVSQQDRTWMLRRKGERVQGPFRRDTIEEWISRSVVTIDDEISRPDGLWQPLWKHEDFRAWFTPGDLHFQNRLSTVSTRRRERRAESRNRILAITTFVLVLAVSVSLTPLALQGNWTIIPEPAVTTMLRYAGSAWSRAYSTVKHATDESDAQEAIASLAQLPGESLIDDLTAQYSAGSGATDLRNLPPAELALLEGKALLLELDSDSTRKAVQKIEEAVVLLPRYVPALTALAEAYSLAGNLDSHKAGEAATLLSRAGAINTHQPQIYQARSAMGLAGGSFDTALQAANRCLEMDGSNLLCLYFKARALMGLGKPAAAEPLLTDLVEKAPHVPRFQLALCQQALAADQLAAARRALDKFQRNFKNVAEAHALDARLSWLVADWERALAQAGRAAGLEAGLLEMRVLEAELSLVLRGPGAALKVLEPLLKEPALGSTVLSNRAYLVAARAKLALGDYQAAIDNAQNALSYIPNWGPAALALGYAQWKSGDPGSAQNSIKSADGDDLSPVDAGRLHVALGRLYAEQGRDKAALTAFRRAIDVDKDCVMGRLGLAETYLRLENPRQALTTLQEIPETDFEQRNTHPPYQVCWLQTQSMEPLRTAFREAALQDFQIKDSLNDVDGLLAYLEGDLDAASRLFSASLSMDDSDDMARAFLARIAIHRGEWGKARELLTRLAATRPKVGIYAAWLGLAMAYTGQTDSLEPVFQRAFQTTELQPGPHRLFARVLFMTGQKDRALEEADKVISMDPMDHRVRRLVLEGTLH